jgi:hypothetical protein
MQHAFLDDLVGYMLSYLFEPRPWVKQIVAIAHNAKAFDLQFILDRAIFLKGLPEIIMNGQAIMCLTVEHIRFIDSISYLPFQLRKVAGAFGLLASKSCYPHYLNTKENLNYVGAIADMTYYCADQMGVAERTEFLEWYGGEKTELFDNKRLLEAYCQDDFTVLRQACKVFRRKFITIGYMEVFLESITIASACNGVLRKQFLKPGTMGRSPTGVIVATSE